MNLTDENKIISSKNKAFRNWKKHNFIFKKFSSLLYEKIIDIKKEFKDVLVITSDFDETISEIKSEESNLDDDLLQIPAFLRRQAN